MISQKEIREDLTQQLIAQGKHQSYYIDMIDQYVNYFAIKNKLLRDIKKEGIRIETTNGNGFKTSKVNESIDKAQRVTQLMLKILSDLELEKPIAEDSADEDYL
jgi:hypothetical protein